MISDSLLGQRPVLPAHIRPPARRRARDAVAAALRGARLRLHQQPQPVPAEVEHGRDAHDLLADLGVLGHGGAGPRVVPAAHRREPRLEVGAALAAADDAAVGAARGGVEVVEEAHLPCPAPEVDAEAAVLVLEVRAALQERVVDAVPLHSRVREEGVEGLLDDFGDLSMDHWINKYRRIDLGK